MTISNFHCPHCGTVVPLPRKMNHQRASGHLKKLWCPGCKRKINFVEEKEGEFFMNMAGERL